MDARMAVVTMLHLGRCSSVHLHSNGLPQHRHLLSYCLLCLFGAFMTTCLLATV